MRETKLRVWNTAINQVCEVMSVYWHNGEIWAAKIKKPGSNPIKDGWIDVTGEDINRIIFEQFTGLQDKNGKDIYEGDIVRYMELVFPIRVNEQHGYRFMFGLDGLCRDFEHSAEVIGNIHENPDLLPASPVSEKG